MEDGADERHPNPEPVFRLLKIPSARIVVDFLGDDFPDSRQWVHQYRVLRQKIHLPLPDNEAILDLLVELRGHAFLLDASPVDNICVLQRIVKFLGFGESDSALLEVVDHVSTHRRLTGRDEDDLDRFVHRQHQGEGTRRATTPKIAADNNSETVDLLHPPDDGVDIEQSLGGVLSTPRPAVDDRHRADLRRIFRTLVVRMTQYDDIRHVAARDTNRVRERFSLCDR